MVSLIGPIAPPQWGPAVKNRIMLDVLHDWEIDVEPLNTLEWKTAPFRFLFRVLGHVWKSRQVILAVSQNGRLTLIPLIGLLGFFRALHTILMPAGGTFGPELQALPSAVRKFYLLLLKRFDRIYVERLELSQQLETLGLSNVDVLPNFKVSPASFPEKLPRDGSRLLFLSRIRKVKGIEPLLDALDMLVTQGYHFSIDFYGIVQADYEAAFEGMLARREYARYCGVIPYDDVIRVISDYDLMVFPTVVLTEGFPGVLADAAMAGLPVVASNVPSNREIVEDGVNGLLAAPDDPADLASKIGRLLEDAELCAELAENNRIKGREYAANVVLGRLIQELRALGWVI